MTARMRSWVAVLVLAGCGSRVRPPSTVDDPTTPKPNPATPTTPIRHVLRPTITIPAFTFKQLLVADSHYQQILIYTPEGELVQKIPGTLGEGNLGLRIWEVISTAFFEWNVGGFILKKGVWEGPWSR